MTRITMEEQEEFLVFPVDSMLLLKVLEANDVDVPGRDGREGWTKCSFKFKIMQVLYVGDGSPTSAYDEMVGKEIFGSVPWRLNNSPENKLRIWGEALLQVPMDLGFNLDTNMFPGRMAKGVTSQYDGKATNPATGQKYKRHQIDNLLPVAGAGAGSPVQGQGAQQGWGGPPPQAQQGWGQPQVQQPPQQWATPGVPPQAPAAQPQGQPQQQWAPQQNLQQQGQEQQPPQQQGFAQQQVAAYTQSQAPLEDPWAPPPSDPSEPGF